MPQVKQVAVEIERDNMTTIPREVPVHELPVLHAIFGKENVRETGAEAQNLDIESVDGEVGRIEQKYGAGALEKTFGQAFTRELAKEVAANVVADSDTASADTSLSAMSKDELLALAAERGVSANAGMNKAAIVAAIEAAAAA